MSAGRWDILRALLQARKRKQKNLSHSRGGYTVGALSYLNSKSVEIMITTFINGNLHRPLQSNFFDL